MVCEQNRKNVRLYWGWGVARVGQVPQRPRAAAELSYYASKGLRPVKFDAENRAHQAKATKRKGYIDLPAQ
jgi:hypothetical protein